MRPAGVVPPAKMFPVIETSINRAKRDAAHLQLRGNASRGQIIVGVPHIIPLATSVQTLPPGAVPARDVRCELCFSML